MIIKNLIYGQRISGATILQFHHSGDHLRVGCLAFGNEIHLAAESGELEKLKALLASGADANAESEKNGLRK